MAFYLTEGESLSSGLRRVAIEQIDRACESLANSDRDEAIHAARRCFKKLRGLLRLVREEIGEDIYELENRCFRDLGRRLAGQRDIASVREAVQRLLKEPYDEASLQLLHRLDESLTEHLGKRTGVGGNLDDIITDVVSQLGEARTRAEEWPLERNRFAAIDRGLKRIYRDGRRAYGVITGDPTDENLHEWRKQVKYLWYCARILERSWPQLLHAMIHELHALSDALGDDHDLAMLRTLLRRHTELAGGDEPAGRLLALIDTQRAALQEKAKSLGSRIYSERPKPFIRRMRTYWKTWRGGMVEGG
jgi:CHAD domain-containing protein